MDRKKLLILTLLGIFYGFILNVAYSAPTPTHSPIGYWKTIDDMTGKPKSIIQIWKTEENELMGRVVKIFSKVGKEQSPVCMKCKGEKRNQPIVGMVIVSKLKAKEKHWSNGEILDPENGKTYSCNMRTLENGKRLHVNGYIGLPLLGRSETWERVDLMSG